VAAAAPPEILPGAEPTFSGFVQPILQARCLACHSASTPLGGWDASSYETVSRTGENAPVTDAGDVESSLLARLIQGLDGKSMPPGGSLPLDEIQIIVDWIAAGAKNN
jgi:uncharacterized membrane protein